MDTRQFELDIFYLRKAYKAAKSMSTDPRTQVGAVLVNREGKIIETANMFPYDVMEKPERWTKEEKPSYIVHAERNAVCRAAELGISTYNATLYAPWFACCICAQTIIQARIKRVVGHASELYESRPDWKPEIEKADQMLKEGNVKFERIKYDFSDIEILFDGVVSKV
jgi:deoxycytidylate deaminase